MLIANNACARELAKEVSQSKTGSISAKRFNEILSSTGPLSTSSSKKKKDYNFAFTFTFERLSPKKYKATLYGNHRRVNEINGWLSLGKRMAYKNAIKNAVRYYFLSNRKKLEGTLPSSALMNTHCQPVSFVKRSRDDDANSITMKTLRDTLELNGIIYKDSRKHFTQEKDIEVIDKEMKIELFLTDLSE